MVLHSFHIAVLYIINIMFLVLVTILVTFVRALFSISLFYVVCILINVPPFLPYHCFILYVCILPCLPLVCKLHEARNEKGVGRVCM